MILFALRRLFGFAVTLFVAALVVFWLLDLLPGDPAQFILGINATPESVARLRAQMGLDAPAHERFLAWIWGMLRGDFGMSYRQRRPVSELIESRMPATLELSFVSAVIALFLGIPMGIYTALRRDGVLSRSFMTLSLIGISLPTFLIGILMILFFGVMLRWLPSFGRGEVVQLGWWSTGFLTKSGWQSLIMPAFTLALFQMTLIMRLVRAEMLEVMQTDFIKFARARGLPERMINFRHALKNTLVPVITITGLQLGSIIAFSIITETVFQWPGMGLLFIQSISAVDIPVMAAYLLLIAFFFVIINLIVDLLYFAVDPRLRVQKN